MSMITLLVTPSKREFEELVQVIVEPAINWTNVSPNVVWLYANGVQMSANTVPNIPVVSVSADA
jgi:hypothetical protein